MQSVFNNMATSHLSVRWPFLFGGKEVEVKKSKFRRIAMILILTTITILFVSNYTLAQQYIVTDLGEGIAFDINNNSQVVGAWPPDPQGTEEGFYWDSTRGRENIDLGGHGGFLGINNIGEAIQLNWFHPPKGRIWNSTSGGVEEIPIFPKAINNSAYVTGWTGGGPGGGNLAVVWDEANDIQPIAGGINGIGNDVNDYGEVVGEYSVDGQPNGFIWDSSNGLRNIPTLGGDRAEAFAINNLAQVVGDSRTSNTTHAFIWDETSGIRDLGTLEYCPAETDQSTAYDINSLGQVVGRSCARSVERPQGVNAVLWDENNCILDLNTVIPADSGWILEEAFAINDSGQIVGYGTFNGEEQRAFLLTPVHEITIDVILKFFYESVDDETIYGRGRRHCRANARLWLFGQMLESVKWHLDHDRTKAACRKLNSIDRRCDGDRRPPDFIDGDADTMGTLTRMLDDLETRLGCE
jgi:probable HAF family extracellular repeat protein